MAYLDGELAGVGEHVESCEECQRLVADLRTVSRKLSEWTVTPATLRPSRILSPVRAERPVRRWRWTRPVLGLGFATVVMLVLVLGLMSPTYWRNAKVARSAADLAGTRMRAVLVAPPMIARTAQITLVTNDFGHARARLEAILKAHHGYIGQLT